jgi:hypothetical protein
MSRAWAASTGGAEISAMRSAPGLAVIDEDPAEVKIPVPVEVVVGG